MPLTSTQTQKGFTLIEVLITSLILAIGILGIATLMLTSLKSDQSALYRSMASAYIYDIADRIRKNSEWAKINTGYDNISTENAAPSQPQCMTDKTGCTAENRKDLDIREWTSNFTDVYATGQFNAALPNAIGTVIRGGGNLFTITISWSEVDWDEANPTQKVDSDESLSIDIIL